MPRYFFHVQDGRSISDQEGILLADPKAARAQAVVLSAALLNDLGGEFWGDPDWRMTVMDEAGWTVCDLRLTGG